jgi:predicted acetyltransferase
MAIQRYETLPELIANLGPMEHKLFSEFGQENYMYLMEMWASVVENNFDEWCENYDQEFIEHVMELSTKANKLTKMYDNKKLSH